MTTPTSKPPVAGNTGPNTPHAHDASPDRGAPYDQELPPDQGGAATDSLDGDAAVVADPTEDAAPTTTDDEAAVVDEGEAGDEDKDQVTVPTPTVVTRAIGSFPPLHDVLRLGDPGRQMEIVPVSGPLAVGVADTELDFATVDPFEVRACSTRGASHRHTGKPRQDAFCVASNERWLVVTVADGVSHGAHSQVAAETAARAACKLLLECVDDTFDIDWGLMANRVSRRIVDEAKYRRLVDLSEVEDPAEQIRTVRATMSTTAVVAAVSRVAAPDGEFPFVVGVLAGDSGAYLLSDERWSPVAGGKEVGDTGIADGAVRPLPGPADPVVFRAALGEGQVLLLTSDGVGDPLGDGSGPVGQALAQAWAKPPTAGAFFNQINFLRRTFDDDRTAVGVWVLPPDSKVVPDAGVSADAGPDGPSDQEPDWV